MKRPTLSLFVYLLLVFASGAVVGVLGQRFYSVRTAAPQRPPRKSAEEYRRHLMDEMRTRLKLRPEQEQGVNAVLDVTREQWRQLDEQGKALREKLQQDHAKRMHAILDADQSVEYDKMRKERDERRKQHAPPPPGR